MSSRGYLLFQRRVFELLALSAEQDLLRYRNVCSFCDPCFKCVEGCWDSLIEDDPGASVNYKNLKRHPGLKLPQRGVF